MLDGPDVVASSLPQAWIAAKLSLNGFVAYGRVKVFRAFFQAPQDVAG